MILKFEAYQNEFVHDKDNWRTHKVFIEIITEIISSLVSQN